MATYDLTCRSCDNVFEVFSMGFLKDDQKQCPACGSTDVQQKFTSFMCGGTSSSASSASAGSCAAPAGCGFT